VNYRKPRASSGAKILTRHPEKTLRVRDHLASHIITSLLISVCYRNGDTVEVSITGSRYTRDLVIVYDKFSSTSHITVDPVPGQSEMSNNLAISKPLDYCRLQWEQDYSFQLHFRTLVLYNNRFHSR
jgi:hypothetical protein